MADTTGAVTTIGESTLVIVRISDFQTRIASAVEQQTATTVAMIAASPKLPPGP